MSCSRTSACQPFREAAEEAVRDGVAERLIHVLEAIHVDAEQAGGPPGSTAAGQRLRQAIFEELPVRQPRERVVVGHVEQDRLPPLGEAAHHGLSRAHADVASTAGHDEAVEEVALAIVGEGLRHEVNRRVLVGDERRGVHQVGDRRQDESLSAQRPRATGGR